jgi:anti-sigma regulatory factor (Ser/Thr protein kinase)
VGDVAATAPIVSLLLHEANGARPGDSLLGVTVAATTVPSGCVHETAFYGSDEELLAVTMPFLAGGVEAGEPTIVAFDGHHSDMVRRALGDVEGVRYLGDAQYSRPAWAIQRLRQLVVEHMEAGAERVRVVGDMPHPGVGVPWDWWCRYEATVNYALRDVPLWGLCPYDTRITPDYVLADAVATHPFLAMPDGRHVVNDRYEPPARFLAQRPAPPPDPFEARPPAVALIGPTAAEARHAVADLAQRSCLEPVTIDNLVVGVSESVANANTHGRPPVELRAWAVPDRMVVTVTDHGSGPDDPYVGLLPGRTTAEGAGGLGMWITFQLCDDVVLARHDDGFTVRLVAGRP